LYAIALGLGMLLPLAALDLPKQAPELVIRQVDGQQLLLSQFRGKVVAVEFLHTTCPHCQNCSSLLEKMYKEYGSRGFQPLGVAFNDMATLLVPDYVKQLGLTFPVGVGTRDEVIGYLEFPLVKPLYVPQLIFIDRKGMIRAYYPGGDKFYENEETNMRGQIEALLKESSPANNKAKAKTSSKAASLPHAQALQ
jgi:peroxiredoxin